MIHCWKKEHFHVSLFQIMAKIIQYHTENWWENFFISQLQCRIWSPIWTSSTLILKSFLQLPFQMSILPAHVLVQRILSLEKFIIQPRSNSNCLDLYNVLLLKHFQFITSYRLFQVYIVNLYLFIIHNTTESLIPFFTIQFTPFTQLKIFISVIFSMSTDLEYDYKLWIMAK